jgi:hypothetical protein
VSNTQLTEELDEGLGVLRAGLGGEHQLGSTVAMADRIIVTDAGLSAPLAPIAELVATGPL